ncbi:hypothetical protein IGI04_014803 [Brassica rapa subsp. trilocularis]|uniref:Uncharacterized protein n=1 Tax=Brassica rapa subsp. trilocularis TaxID=1813537 RepID=A0ABQ7MQR0_BRACM|nr:hypothetical protein IGI04_014803 [Brassica rapa subsp. trilocularis]
MQRQRQRKKKVTFACGRRRRRWKRRKEHSQGKIQSDLLVSVTERGCDGWVIKALVWCQIVYWSARLWKKYAVLFQKIEKMAVGGTYEYLDSSERKLQRSMTGLLSCGTRQVQYFEASRLVQFSEVLSCWSAGSVSGVEDQILVDVGELRQRCYKFKSAGYVSGYGSSRFRNSSPRQVEVTAYTGWSKHIQFGGTEIAFEGAMTLVVSRVESCLYKCCSAHLQMFFGFRWSSATGSDEFLKSSQCIEGKENQVECVQENVKCSDIKAESEREKQFLGGAIFSKESCIIRVLSSSLVQQEKSHHEHEIDVKEAVKETVQVQVSRLSWLDRRLVESGLIQGGNKYVSGFCKRFSVVFLILISEILYIESLLNRVVLSGVFCWQQQRCRVVFKSVCSSSGCEENLRLSSWCLLFVEIGFKGFESRSFWFEASDSCSASDSSQASSEQLMGFVELRMSAHLKFPGYGKGQIKINEEVEHITRLQAVKVELRLRGSKEQ